MRSRARLSIFNGNRFMGDIDIIGHSNVRKRSELWRKIGIVLCSVIVTLCVYILVRLID